MFPRTLILFFLERLWGSVALFHKDQSLVVSLQASTADANARRGSFTVFNLFSSSFHLLQPLVRSFDSSQGLVMVGEGVVGGGLLLLLFIRWCSLCESYSRFKRSLAHNRSTVARLEGTGLEWNRVGVLSEIHLLLWLTLKRDVVHTSLASVTDHWPLTTGFDTDSSIMDVGIWHLTETFFLYGPGQRYLTLVMGRFFRVSVDLGKLRFAKDWSFCFMYYKQIHCNFCWCH